LRANVCLKTRVLLASAEFELVYVHTTVYSNTVKPSVFKGDACVMVPQDHNMIDDENDNDAGFDATLT